MASNTTSPVKTSHDPACSNAPEIVSTAEIQKWISYTESCLNEICSITKSGKLNSEQKLKVSSLCRKITHNSSQMAILYQSLKQKAIQSSLEIEVLNENRDLAGYLTGLKKTIEESCPATKGSSFADVVKKGTNDYIRPSNLSSVAVYPIDVMKTSEDTKAMVQKLISPEQLKLHVRGVRKTKNGGVIINTETKTDADKLKNAVMNSAPNLQAEEPSKRRPRIVVIGVPTTMTEQEVYKCIYDQNVEDKFPSMDYESFLSLIKLSHKSGKRDTMSCNYVIEVSAQIRKALITQQRLFINWTSCPVRDFTIVTRCYKCQQFGHAAKSCHGLIPSCSHCGEIGHTIAECNNKLSSLKCATCSKFKKPNDHKTGANECPARKIAELRYINSIDYEVA